MFTLKSHDQGWGGNGDDRNTYRGSFTWFDVGKEKFTARKPSKDEKLVESSDTQSQNYDFLMGSADGGETPLQCTLQPISPPLVISGEEEARPKLDHPYLPTKNSLQRNLTATSSTKKHVITWDYDDHLDSESSLTDHLDQAGRGRATANGEFVRDLKVGDVVTVWARARFPGWVHHVEEVKMAVYWQV